MQMPFYIVGRSLPPSAAHMLLIVHVHVHVPAALLSVAAAEHELLPQRLYVATAKQPPQVWTAVPGPH